MTGKENTIVTFAYRHRGLPQREWQQMGLVNSLVVSFERKGSASIAMIPSIMICRGREEGNKEIYRNIEIEKNEKKIYKQVSAL